MSGRAANFDRVARIYRWAEYLALGPLLQRTRTHFLPELDSCRDALVLGDGDGRFLAALLRRNQQIRATAIDSSGSMLKLLRKRCGFASDRLETAQASLLDITPSHATDTIATHFVLDCFTQPELHSLAQHLAASTQTGTLWVVSDFGTPKAPLLRPLATAYIRALYLAFAALTGLGVRELPTPQKALEGAGFALVARHERLGGFLYSELWGNNARRMADIHSSMSEVDSPQPPYDAIPDPEPAAPSLPEPDSGVYHHETGTPRNDEPTKA